STLTTGSLATARFDSTATLLPNGTVLIAGGQNSSGTALTTTEIYTPGTQLLTAGPGPLTVGRAGHSATFLPNVGTNGSILFAGGSGSNSAELYDLNTGLFTPTGNMTVDRTNHTATLLPDGNVLITGGTSSGTAV